MPKEDKLTPEQIKTITEYLEGKSVPPSETADYLINRLRAVKKEGDEVGKQLQELKQLTATAAQHLTGLNSQYNAYGRDLLAWLEKAAASERKAFSAEERAKMLEITKVVKPTETRQKSG